MAYIIITISIVNTKAAVHELDSHNGLFAADFCAVCFSVYPFCGVYEKGTESAYESLKETLIDRDNPVGLSGDELQKLKAQQKEAQAHLKQVIAKLPVVKKDGRFQIDEAQLKQRRSERAEGSGGDEGAA